MLSSGAAVVGQGRRARVPCRLCGRKIELSGMRAHLRDAHQMGSAELESSFLVARREARRSSRTGRR